jgi:hypothetical protein
MVLGKAGQKYLGNLISVEKSWMWWCLPVITDMVRSIKYEDCGSGLGIQQDFISKMT